MLKSMPIAPWGRSQRPLPFEQIAQISEPAAASFHRSVARRFNAASDFGCSLTPRYNHGMRRPRFKLATLLLLTTFVALVLGYTQLRRQRISRELDAAAKDGASFVFEDHWFWPFVPSQAQVNYTYVLDGKLLVRSSVHDEAGARKHFQDLRARLNKLGVGKTAAVIDLPRGFGTTFDRIPDLGE